MRGQGQDILPSALDQHGFAENKFLTVSSWYHNTTVTDLEPQIRYHYTRTGKLFPAKTPSDFYPAILMCFQLTCVSTGAER